MFCFDLTFGLVFECIYIKGDELGNDDGWLRRPCAAR